MKKYTVADNGPRGCLLSSLFKYFDMRDINEKERVREQLLKKLTRYLSAKNDNGNFLSSPPIGRFFVG